MDDGRGHSADHVEEFEDPNSDHVHDDTPSRDSGQQLVSTDGQELVEELGSSTKLIEITGSSQDAVEEDDTEGLKDSLKKGYKAVKRLIKGPRSPGQEKVDPVSTYLVEGEQPAHTPVPPSEDSDEYDFSHRKRGCAIIINNEKFRPTSMFDSRPGSSLDAYALKEVFKKLGFDVKCHTDLSALEMKQELEKEARLYDHQNADCLVVAILSHGDSEVLKTVPSYYHAKSSHHSNDKVRRDLIFGVDGSHISTASVIRTFQDDRCPGLCGKPRLFFLQACRGENYDDGVNIAVVPDDGVDDVDNGDQADDADVTDARSFHLAPRRQIVSPAPIFKDFLVMYATTPGHFAWRRTTGTWFVQSFHSVFTKQLTPHMSLTQALTRVTRMVAQGFESKGKGHLVGKKQTPVIESMLTKDVYFNKK